MRRLDDPEFKPFLIELEWAKRQIGEYNNKNNAVMVIPFKDIYAKPIELRVIASSGKGWDHVSVSLAHRTPTWYELEYVRKLLFKPDETVVQFHLPARDHVNIHPNTLHLWRPIHKKLPLPPKELV